MPNENTKKMTFENLEVEIFANRALLGKKAAEDIGLLIQELLKHKNEVRMIFAAAPSQNELLSELVKSEIIDWTRIVAFHMDEYLDLDINAPQAFGKFLKDRLFDRVNIKEVNYLYPDRNDIEAICENYTNKLVQAPIDIVCMGIGENGHIAFNDPPYAKFEDPKMVKIIKLDQASRQQQVNDGCFKQIKDVPKEAITLTIPALMAGKRLIVVVPGSTKAKAVKESLEGKMSENCPASILRSHKNAKLYLDQDSSALINNIQFI